MNFRASGSGRMMSALNRSYLYATRYKAAELGRVGNCLSASSDLIDVAQDIGGILIDADGARVL